MTRTLATALALGALSVALLTGCNRAKTEAPQPPSQQPAAVTVTQTPPAGAGKTDAKTDVDGQLNDVDGLLNQVDNQLKADSQNAPDAD